MTKWGTMSTGRSIISSAGWRKRGAKKNVMTIYIKNKIFFSSLIIILAACFYIGDKFWYTVIKIDNQSNIKLNVVYKNDNNEKNFFVEPKQEVNDTITIKRDIDNKNKKPSELLSFIKIYDLNSSLIKEL